MTDQGGKFCGASPARMKTSSGELDAHYDAVMTSSPKRVMCLMSDTGGGHRASAQALKDGFEVLLKNNDKKYFFKTFFQMHVIFCLD